MKTLNEIYKMSDDEFWDYESALFIHHHLVKDEAKRRITKEENANKHRT